MNEISEPRLTWKDVFSSSLDLVDSPILFNKSCYHLARLFTAWDVKATSLFNSTWSVGQSQRMFLWRTIGHFVSLEANSHPLKDPLFLYLLSQQLSHITVHFSIILEDTFLLLTLKYLYFFRFTLHLPFFSFQTLESV